MSLTSHSCCARLKILKQAWIFSVSPTITLQGLCIHRKAINKEKPTVHSWILFCHGLDAASTLVPGGHYQIVTGGNALGIDSIPQMLPGGQYAAGLIILLQPGF